MWIKKLSALSCSSIFFAAALADKPLRIRVDANAAVKQAFARLAQQKNYRIESKGRSGDSKIDSRIDAQFPDHFYILNRGPNPSELILTPDGSFAKPDAGSPWRAVPMSYLSIAESIGPKANENLLKTMRQVTLKGVAKCFGGEGAGANAVQYQFETDGGVDAKAPMRTTITISDHTGLPCRIRAQQTEEGIDTTATYDYTSKFSIRLPK